MLLEHYIPLIVAVKKRPTVTFHFQAHVAISIRKFFLAGETIGDRTKVTEEKCIRPHRAAETVQQKRENLELLQHRAYNFHAVAFQLLGKSRQVSQSGGILARHQ